MNLDLADDWAVVAGSSRGIGKAIAAGLLHEGARVAVTGRDRQAVELTAKEFSKSFGSDRILAFAGNLAQQATVAELKAAVMERGGRLDHLVCNIGDGRSVPPLDEDETEVKRMLEVNFLTSVATVNGLRDLLERTASARGIASLLFIGSICGGEALGCPVGYASAKAALASYAANIARPLARRGVRVNVLTPGNVLFPGSTWERKLAESPTAVATMLDRDVPLERLGTAEEVANVAVFLCSRRAAYVSGANWVVDGGQSRI